MASFVRSLMASFSLNRKKPSSSSTTINDLPCETLLEILYKLPAKQLHRNKIVCKLWSSLVAHPSFGSEFLLRGKSNRPTHTTLFLTYNYDLVYSIVSSNGLLLCTSYDDNFRNSFYFVVNPVTKQWLALPPPPTNQYARLSGFVCNPSYESANGSTRFKVVRIVSCTRELDSVIDSNVLEFEIFDSATSIWMVLKRTIDAMIGFDKRVDAIEHKGILYWESRISYVVVTFNPNSYVCFCIPLPESYSEEFLHVFGASQDHLYYYVEIDYLCTLWRCDEFEREYTWSVYKRFDLNWIHDGFKPKFSPFDWMFYYDSLSGLVWKALAIDPTDCNILYLSVYVNSSSIHRIYSLDLENKKMKKLRFSIMSDIGKMSGYIRQGIVVELLSWPTSLPQIEVNKYSRLVEIMSPFTPIEILHYLEVKKQL